MAKSIYTSKTVWVALLILIASVLNIAGVVKLDVSPDAAWMGVALSLIQIALRLITKEPIELTKDSGPGGFKTPLFLILLLPMLIVLSGCNSKVVQKDVVRDKTISVVVPEQNYQLPMTAGNLTETQYKAYDTASQSYPDTAYVVAKNNNLTARYYLKKKSYAYLSTSRRLTQLYQIQRISTFSRPAKQRNLQC